MTGLVEWKDISNISSFSCHFWSGDQSASPHSLIYPGKTDKWFISFLPYISTQKQEDPVAWWDALPPGIQTVEGLILRSTKTLFWGIGQEIISTAILSLSLIQVGQLSVTGRRMCTKYWLTA